MGDRIQVRANGDALLSIVTTLDMPRNWFAMYDDWTHRYVATDGARWIEGRATDVDDLAKRVQQANATIAARRSPLSEPSK